ncbi:MAG: DUF4386 family protein [Anaerolineae bacterium]
MTDPSDGDGVTAVSWRAVYRIGGVATIIAGLVFRRNLAAEIGLFVRGESPVTAGDWFDLLERNRLLGLAYLNLFDIVNYMLVALMFVALCHALREISEGPIAVAGVLALLGIGAYLASNTAFSMLSLAEQYAAATDEAQRAGLRAAGEALLATGRFTGAGSHPGAGGYLSLLLIATAGLIMSRVMLQSRRFGRFIPVVGILANALDLAYCVAYVVLWAASPELLATLFIPAAGLLLMVWHILLGWRLYRMGRPETPVLHPR